jgi:hypothetical protein
MDDSKLVNGPVKVRCAKCKEVFVVKPEEPSAESVMPAVQEPAPPAADDEGTADFSFDTPAASKESASQESDDFSFDVETPTAANESASVPEDSSNEFDWQSEASTTSDGSGAGSDFDLSSFDASLAAPNAAADATAAQSDDSDFDFGDLDLNATSTPSAESPATSDTAEQDGFSMDFGEVSFSDHPADSGSSTTNFSEPSAGELPPFPESSGSDDFLLSFNSDKEEQQTSPPATGKEEPENVNFGEFSFGDMGDSASTENAPPASNLKDHLPGEFAATGVAWEEELPPSSLTTRKKSSSLFPLFVIVSAIILIIALAGSGVYFFGGSKAFSKVGLGFLVDWYGDKAGEEGNIALKGVTASYTVNSAAGEFFVVRGEAVNNFKKPRASIQIKVSLLGPGGTNLVTKSAFCGNSLSNDQLATLPLAKIEETMNNQFGDSLVNLGLKPGETIPFVVVVSPVPKDATDYTVLVGGSTVATQ